MTLLNTINVGGTDFKVAGVAILGSCPTPAGSEVKVCTFTDDFELKAGDMLLVKFTYANTYGDGSTTYPKLQVNGTNYTMRRADGSYITAGEWDNNATLTFLFDGTDFILPAGSGSAKGSGIPLGAILAIHSNQVPDGYLPCNGVQFDTAQFAALYALLGDDHTPDLREVTLVGIGQNATDTIATHDVYTLGQFKDDQLQNHTHYDPIQISSTQDGYAMPYTSSNVTKGANMNWMEEVSQGRTGTTTHGKQKGENYIIKATSGLPDDQQDYILSIMNTQRSYSTSEVDTGKKWIDGKTIYRKVVTLPFTVSVATSVQVSSEVSASDFQVIDLGHSYIYDADYGTRQPWASSATTQTNMYISSGRLSFETTHPSGTLYAVCEYTKTTPST